MPRFVIERDIPEFGSADREAWREASRKSNGILAAMRAEKKYIQWEHGYVADNKTFCIFLADNEIYILEQAQRSGFPATNVTRVGDCLVP